MKKMLDLESARTAISREWEAFIERLRSASPAAWKNPVRCEGWSVADLAAHVAWGLSLEADALHRMREGISEPATGEAPEKTATPEKLTEAVSAGIGNLVTELVPLTTADMSNLVPMPYGPIQAPFALQIFAMEAGVHGDDLADALGEQEELAEDVQTATTVVISASFPLLALRSEKVPEIGTRYRLSGERIHLDFSYAEGGWKVAQPENQPTCEISGSDSSLLLFALGRILPGDLRLTITGEKDMARRFKAYFPGP